MKLKKFNQFEDSSINENNTENPEVKVKVKDLIEFLSNLNPEMEVFLDHDGWHTYNYTPKDVQDLIGKRGLFDVFKDTLYINN